MTEHYAYGANRVDGCDCPAVATGREPDGGALTRLVAQYDERLQHSPSDEGTVREVTAKEAWREAIRHFERTAFYSRSAGVDEDTYYGTLIDLGYQIADDMGWDIPRHKEDSSDELCWL